MNTANKEASGSIRGRRESRSNRISADEKIAEQLRTAPVPGHRDFVRKTPERFAPAVIGSSLPYSLRRLLSLS